MLLPERLPVPQKAQGAESVYQVRASTVDPHSHKLVVELTAEGAKGVRQESGALVEQSKGQAGAQRP